MSTVQEIDAFSAGTADTLKGMDANEINNLRRRRNEHHTTDDGHDSEEFGPPDWVELGFPKGFDTPPANVVPYRLDNNVICYFDAGELAAALENGIKPEDLVLAKN